MFKKVLFLLLISALLPFHMNAEWVPINKNKTSKTQPQVTIISQDDNSTILKIDISGFDLNKFDNKGRSFQTVDLLTDIFTTKPGFPQLPYIANVLAVPDRASISVEVIETGNIQTFKNIHLPPARESWIEGHPETPYSQNTKAFESTTIYPLVAAAIDPPSVMRDFRIARVSVFPIRYIASKNELEVASSITVRINYNIGKGEVINPKTSSRKAIAPSFAKLYRSFILNYQDVLNTLYNGNEDGRELMLCIVPDNFVATFEPYAEWKRQSGTDVVITKFSDIGANSSNPVIIKDHIIDAYYNWEYPPTYVLMVGDDGIFPTRIVDYDYSFANEDYFVEIDGDDFFPEMMIGRITNQNDYQLQVMLNKFMMYEKEPYVAETDWFKKAVFCSNNEYESQVGTKRFAANILIEDGGFTSVDTLMSDGGYGGGGCSMSLTDVKNAINEGRSFLNYRGEGWIDGWWANCYQFNNSSVSSLYNGEKLTFVTSIGCGVAMFNASGGNCFGEEWLQLGSTDSPRGAIAFVGPGSNTHTTYNNRIDKGIYVGMFQEGMDTPGQALLRGKLYMYNVFGTDPMVEYHHRVFYVLGDPSIHIWKDVPLDINVSYSPSIPVGYNQPGFTITHTSTGLPVANAQVCIVSDDVFATGISDLNGVANVGVTPLSPETLIVTVRGGNVIPFQGTINVTQTAEHVAPSNYPIIVDIDGNVDGIINPNENCNITFTLKNWGTETSNNVQGTLSAVQPDFVEVITTSPVSFGNLSPGGSNTGSPFQFHILPNCPVGEVITLKLDVTSTNSSWKYNYSEEIMGCNLIFNHSFVDDEGSIERNFRMDPGETVKVYISVENAGVDIAPDVMGVLRSNDEYITIVDSVGSFGTLNINAIEMNSSNHFVVSVDPSCPTDYYAEYSLKLYTENGNYPYETIVDLSIGVGVPLSTDYTGPDAYGYYAYSSDDTIYEQSPDYDWVEIKYLGTEMEVPNISNYTITVDLPFTFKYYGNDYDNLRISTDGWVALGTGSGSQTAPTNFAIPHYDNINNMVAVFWDDLHEGYYEQGEIYYYYDQDNNRFIVEWDGIAHNDYSWPPKQEYFQVILLDEDYYNTTTGNGEIIAQYKIVKQTRSNTIGIENSTQDIGLQYVYNRGYDATASVLRNETAIKFTTEMPLVLVSIDEEPASTLNSSLQQNYPNPFSIQTRINYSIQKSSGVTLSVYNVKGELVKTLQNGHQQEGGYSVVWDGTNEKGSKLSSGLYFYSIKTDYTIETRKLFMLR
ncbi:MAG: C25 family cysteine peptidase [Bacteroidota bacterium]